MGTTTSARTTAKKGQKAFLENAAAFMNLPGEWYMDSTAGEIHFLAEAGFDPKSHK